MLFAGVFTIVQEGELVVQADGFRAELHQQLRRGQVADLRDAAGSVRDRFPGRGV